MEKNWQSVTKLNGVKNAIMQVTCFLNGPMFNLLFYWNITLHWGKVNAYQKFKHNSKLYGKCQRFNAIDGSIKMLKNGWASKYFNENEKLQNILRGSNSKPRLGNYSTSPKFLELTVEETLKIINEMLIISYKNCLFTIFRTFLHNRVWEV